MSEDFDPYAYAATQASPSPDGSDALTAQVPHAPASAPAPEYSLTVTLPRSSWDVLVGFLGGYPYWQVSPLIDPIKQQTSAQLSQLELLEVLMRAPISTPRQ